MNYLDTVKKISGQMWNIFKSHLPVKNDDEYWEELISTYSKVVKQYARTKFYDYAGEMMILYTNELQRLWRKEFRRED